MQIYVKEDGRVQNDFILAKRGKISGSFTTSLEELKTIPGTWFCFLLRVQHVKIKRDLFRQIRVSLKRKVSQNAVFELTL